MDWILLPYGGANQLEFGMLPDAVVKILGAPQTVQKRPNSVVNEFRGVASPMVRYSSNAMNQLVFGPRVGRVYLYGMDYHATAPAAFLVHVKKQDMELWRSPGGSIISLKLGISFDEKNPGEADKTIALFAKGVFDEVIAMSSKI